MLSFKILISLLDHKCLLINFFTYFSFFSSLYSSPHGILCSQYLMCEKEKVKACISLHSPFIFIKRFFGEGDGTPLQYSCLENPMDGRAW